MNRRIRKHIKQVREKVAEIDANLDFIDALLSDGEPEEISEETPEETNVTWPTADEPEREGVYFSQLKELSSLKDITIVGQVTKVFDLKSYVRKDDKPGLLYRLVLTEVDPPHNDIVAITFDEMAGKFKEHMIGTVLRITNAWKVEKNKHGIYELHIGNFAKVEVVE